MQCVEQSRDTIDESGSVNTAPSTSNTQAEKRPSDSLQQSMNKRQALLSTNLFVPSRADKNKLTDAIAKFVASTCSTYSIVESEGFVNLMRVASPNYVVPSRTTFSERKIPELYTRMKEHLMLKLSAAQYVSITADGWSADNSSQFLGVTCTTLDADWKMDTYTLACREMNVAHTGMNIANTIMEVLEEFGVHKEKVVAVTTDRGANMLAAVKELGLNSVPCFAHVLNTIVSKLWDHASIKPTMQKIRKMHNVLAFSPKAQRTLQELQNTHQKPKHKFPSACATRWWSELRQVVFVLDQQAALADFLNQFDEGKHKYLLLEHKELRMLAALKPLLLTLEKFEVTLSAELQVTSSIVLKSVEDIKAKLAEPIGDILDTGVFQFRKHLQERAKQLGEIFDAATIESSHLHMATFMDPRFDTIDEDAMEQIARLDAQTAVAAVAAKTKPINIDPAKATALGELFGGDSSDDDESNGSDAQRINEELRRYRCKPKVKLRVDISEWCQQRKGVYPILSVLARKYLFITATSVPSEGIFSVGGRVMTESRRSMTDEHVEQLVFLSKNKSSLPFW